MIKVFIFENSIMHHEIIKFAFTTEAMHAEVFSGYDEQIFNLTSLPDAVAVNFNFEGALNGEQLLVAIKQLFPYIPLVMYSRVAKKEAAVIAFELGVYYHLFNKDEHLHHFPKIIRQVVQKFNDER
ncbi:MAG: hypothetical protein MUC81_07550 [Bacteroidia bacterium]|jgi:DNA-binding NtrC family response regulator|nr:hypothetical protein [Bacteroidia bacterium]